MTKLSNTPSGWAAFRVLRQRPLSLSYPRHGNRRHGAYSRSRIEGMRLVRRYAKVVRGAWWLWTPDVDRRVVPPGWESYRIARARKHD
jgi:hypothetical protein